MRQEHIDNAPVRQNVDAVNAAIAGRSGELVLMFWRGEHEAVGEYNCFGGKNTKDYFQAWHIAVGILNGGPIREKWSGPFWLWQLPTQKRMHKLLVHPKIWRWLRIRDFIAPEDSGTYPSLGQAEDLGHNGFGDGERRLARKAEIVIGVDVIRAWLHDNEYTKANADKLFQKIMKKVGLAEQVD